MHAVCRTNKRDGSPCTSPAAGAEGFCWAHDPAHAEKRRKIASRGGRGKASGELPGLKKQLRDLAADVLEGKVDKGAAAVVNQILNTIIRAIEQERKNLETRELAERLEAMEGVLKGRKGA